MKTKKLLEKFGDLLSFKKKKRLKHIDKLKSLLTKLKDKRGKLEKMIPKEKDKHKAKRLSKQLKVINAQREKGLKALQELSKQ
jgi:CHAD domain-containing protein